MPLFPHISLLYRVFQTAGITRSNLTPVPSISDITGISVVMRGCCKSSFGRQNISAYRFVFTLSHQH